MKSNNPQLNFRACLEAGFTLVELLVVIALTSVLILLLFKPLQDSFNLTSRAGTQIESQAAARETLRDLTDTLSSAVYVYDNNTDAASVNFWVADRNGDPALTKLKFGMVEFVAPARQLDQTPNITGYTDPTTGLPFYDSALKPGQKGFAFPLVQGRSVQRLFIGLRDNRSGADTHVVDTNALVTDAKQSGMPVDSAQTPNFHGYASRWDDPGTVTVGSTGKDNRATLYRAEFLPFVTNPFYVKGDPANPQFVVNFSLFHTDPNFDHAKDDPTQPIILDDPNFFYDNSLAGYGTNKGSTKWAVPGWKDLNGDGKVEIWENWAAISSSQLPTYKADAVELQRDSNNQILYYTYDATTHEPTADTANTPTARPIARPLLTFAPTSVQNDAGVASTLNGSDAETPLVSAASFASQHGAWMNPYTVTVYRSDDPTNDPVANPSAVYTLKSTDTPAYVINRTNGTANPVGPTLALINPSGDIAPENVIFNNVTVGGAAPEIAFLPDARRGRVNFAFPQSVYVHRPSPDTTTTARFGNIPNGALAQYYDPAAIDKALDPTTAPFYQKRYLWLKNLDTTLYNVAGITPAIDSGARSPLDIFYAAPTANDATPKVRLVPGSERVFGPDQRPGPHYGYRIQYTRVSANAGAIGQNEYKILYQNAKNAENADSADPRVQTGYIEFDSNPDTANLPNLLLPQNAMQTDNPEDPAGIFVHKVTTKDSNNNDITTFVTGPPTYRPHGLPQLKAIYDPANPSNAPTNGLADPIEVYYSFQLNRPNDVVKLDYLTRDRLTVSVEARLYDPATDAPQTTPLTAQVSVRNLQR